MGKNNKDENQTLIDEIIELKFGKSVFNDKIKMVEVTEWIKQLYNELQELTSDNNEDENNQFDCEFVGTIQSDDNSDGFIPFAVVKKEKSTVEFNCPNCSNSNKLFLSQFRKSQYNNYECPKCHKNVLLKLDFLPYLKIYTESVS